jgi:hypothetical protein
MIDDLNCLYQIQIPNFSASLLLLYLCLHLLASFYAMARPELPHDQIPESNTQRTQPSVPGANNPTTSNPSQTPLPNYELQHAFRVDEKAPSNHNLKKSEMDERALKYKERKARNQRRYYQKYVHIPTKHSSALQSIVTLVTEPHNRIRDAGDQPSE